MGEAALRARRWDRTAEPWFPVAPVMRMGLGVGMAILGVFGFLLRGEGTGRREMVSRFSRQNIAGLDW